MAGRTRTTKKLAQRIDLNYFKKLRGIPRWRRILSAVVTMAGLAWLGWHALAGSPAPYNAGPVAHAHTLFGQKCAACHVSQAGFQRSAIDQACLACHDGPIHHAEQTFAPACSNCHVEHTGVLRLASTSNEACTQCHANLAGHNKNTPPRVFSGIRGFDRSHPEFAVLRAGRIDPGTVKFNHQVHLDPKKPLRGPHGLVQLQCRDCHRAPGRAYMEPINYEKHCSACHPLQFDRRISEPAPHKEPKVVYDFVAQQLTAYIAAHPSEIPLVDEPDKVLPTRPPQRPARNAQEWVQQRLADAQLLLWRKACKECHTPRYPSGFDALPEIPKAAMTARWLTHANFDHEAHQMVTCTSCHTKTLASRETSDVLIPGVQSCRDCHHSGSNAAEARCFECHNYHDWSKEKPVNGPFTSHQLTD
jgi:hypothetical protein